MSGLIPTRWNLLWKGLSIKGTDHKWFELLDSSYSESHRYYHTAQHIAECLTEFDSTSALAAQPLAVEAALWFHDVVYDTQRFDNEEQSSILAERCLLEAGAPESTIQCVRDLILSTKTHDASLHEDGALLVDIDLSILGSSPERFHEYEDQIRQEYLWVPDEVFNTKRSEILRRFLTRKTIYATERYQRSHETQARRNLAASLNRL